MKKNIIFLFLTCILFPVDSSAQNQTKTDSLQSVLVSGMHDSLKIDAMNKLFLVYEFSDTLKALNYLQKALSFSEKIHYRYGIANTYTHFGFYHEDQNRLMLAISFLQKALKIYEELHSLRGMAVCYNNMGLINLNSGNYPKALEIFQITLALNEKLNDKKGMANTYINLGNIHDYQGNLPLALKYYEKSLQIFVQMDNKKRIAACYNNIGAIQFRLKKYKIAIECHEKSLQINELLKNKNGIAYNYTNLGLIMAICGKYFEAKEYYFNALQMYRELENKKEICVVLGNIAAMNNLQKNFNEAIHYAEQDLKIAVNSGMLENEMDSYKELATAYEGLNNFQQALKYHKLFKQINDSLVNTEKNNQVSRMEAIYQNEKKQKEIELKESQLTRQILEVKQQKTQKFAFAGGLIFLLILSFIIYKSYKDKHKANILLARQKHEISEKNEELQQVNEEIKTQRDMIIEQNEELSLKKNEIETQRDVATQQRDLISHQKKELTDSINYAQRIQRAILPPAYYVSSCLPDSFILYLPKDVVSGDFYYVEKINNYVIFAAVDCTGHGVPGSMMSVIGYNLINQAVKLNQITKPSEILSFLDAGVTDTLRQGGGESGVNDGMDIAVCTLNIKTNLLQFAGAYNGVVYIKGTELTEIKADNLAIGVNYDGVVDTYTNHEIQMEKGDLIYLYSDGYADQFGGYKGKKFKYKQLKEIILQNSEESMIVQKEKLMKYFIEWKGDLEQVDDVMIIGVRI